MKRRIALVCVPLAIGGMSAAAHAQSTPQTATITVTGSVGDLCILGGPQVNVGGATNVGNVSGSTVAIANLSDDQELTTKSTDFDVSLSGMCNFGHTLTVSSDRGGLWRNPAGSTYPGFANGVPYRLTVDWANAETILNATAASESELDQPIVVNAPSFGDVTMHFHIDQNATNAGAGAPLVAGTYEDTIRFTLGPQ